jgi:2-iminobutanoate/2-iminopropanoate deaminase
MGLSAVHSDQAPAAIGPYSQAVRSDGLLFCSGQIALDPSSGELIAPDDVAAQTRRVMQNLQAVLEAGGSGLEALVKTTIYLQRIEDFARVNEVYGEYISDPAPAGATVAVAALPKGALVEIDAVARLHTQ